MSTFLLRLQELTNEALEKAREDDVDGAINWGDLSCVRAERCEDQDGDVTYRVWIEEASPDNHELHLYVHNYLTRHLPEDEVDNLEVTTEW